MSDNQEQSHDGDFVQSLERGLSVIRAFDAEHPKLTLSEVAASTGLSRAAARSDASSRRHSAGSAPMSRSSSWPTAC